MLKSDIFLNPLLFTIFYIINQIGLKAKPIERLIFTNPHSQSTMRNVISSQMQLGQTDIRNIIIDVSSRDDIPAILLGLQHIYINKPLRIAIFKILEEIIPHKTNTKTGCIIPLASDKGRPSMEQWSILGGCPRIATLKKSTQHIVF